jgi:hypothetical protein
VVVFNESWFLSTIAFIVAIVVLMKRIGMDLLGEKAYELAIKSVYCIFIYAVIAYLSEIRGKQGYVGSESSDKAFYKWLRIFETFPEGIALIRNNYIMYSNKSLKNILEVHTRSYPMSVAATPTRRVRRRDPRAPPQTYGNSSRKTRRAPLSSYL